MGRRPKNPRDTAFLCDGTLPPAHITQAVNLLEHAPREARHLAAWFSALPTRQLASAWRVTLLESLTDDALHPSAAASAMAIVHERLIEPHL